MPRLTCLSLLVALVLLCPACGGSEHEALARESVSLMKDFGDTLAKVTDKSSAEKQKGKLESIVADMHDVKVRMESKGEPSAEEESALEEKMKAEMAPVMQTMMQEMMRIGQNEEVMAVLGPVFDKLDE